MFPGLTLAHWLTLHGLVTVVAVLLYVITSHVMRQRRQPAAAIAWMLFILLLPYVALPAFLTFGSRKLARPRSSAPGRSLPTPTDDDWVAPTLVSLGQPAPMAYRELHVHADGRVARDTFLAAIAEARHSIDLCTFILGRDALGDAVIDALCRRARQGVRVRLLLDGMGNVMAGRPNVNRLTEAGGTSALFVPPLHSPLKGRTNLRIHRKLLVCDAGSTSARLWSGGRNLAADYFEGRPGHAPWRDLSFDLRGPLVQQAAQMFEHDWAFATGGPVTPEAPAPAQAMLSEKGAQLVASGPDQVDDTVYSLLVMAAYRAQQRIALVTPYFVPEPALLIALCLAARRGVAVDLLLPARSNHRLSDLARGRALRSLAQAGARTWLAPGMLHAKLVVVDDSLALAGSANLDSRSLFLNYEVMLAFRQAGDVQRFAAWFDSERAAACAYVADRPGLARDVAEGMLLWVGFQL